MQELKQPSKKPLIFYYVVIVLVIMLLNATLFPMMWETPVQEVDYTTFMSMTYDDNIGLVQIDTDEIIFTDKAQENFYKTVPIPSDMDLVNRVYEHGGQLSSIDTGGQTNSLLYILLSWILPFLPFLVIGYFLNKRMKNAMGGGDGMMFGMGGNSGAKVYVPSSTGIRFSDVAGEDEAKELLGEIVDFLHDPEKYRSIGAKLPKGALLVGPPGTGKTLLAKAVAGEANVPFFSIAGSEFVEMFVGRGAAKVRDLFKQANEKAPCIVFIDEIDTIGKKRDGQFSGNDEREQTLNQLLTEMDGFDGSKGVVVLAATNRPDSLDPALLRPGRFDRRIPVELPDLQGRIDILKVHAKKIRLAEDVDFEPIAKTAAGASGAELANIVNEAALRAVRAGRQYATQEDLQESVEVVIAGYQKKSRVLSDEEKKIVAYHETGHALVAAMQTHSAPVQKITIIPRTSGALGYTLQVDDGDHFLMSKDELLNKIATYTGGRAAEELVFHSVTTGASNDIEQATKLARSMISRFGMSDEFGFVAFETVSNQYLGGDASLACSPETQARMDQKVTQLVEEQHQKALNILKENEGKLHELADYLYQHETITGQEFMDILERKALPEQE
ncbi:ATP-dependent zinc metalloprotease FtsH [Pseudoflavonifractor capillosus]|uniref:ATP-dependent zinc metalloprotease FtsH n=1 Tax=Pseudoflavonifractor capillosus TaxID=106588 RepID=UPI0019593A6D|nr:ATP-dependent zinc metalloprotease FtsH [Pseudoflavonifractor capillosus]MBM6681146.1 ATP-dependent zinc metalloprotease FtsH [Pseudoflavonifractor capillosus]